MKITIKNSELNSAWENSCWKANKNIQCTEGNTMGYCTNT
jgi:hypothetical protein